MSTLAYSPIGQVNNADVIATCSNEVIEHYVHRVLKDSEELSPGE
ncbi:hypothetical protein J2S74_000327 [Evansella vedderi]|uniref:Uncharacterized protein n=1 Tax=Evansella vedderi TaxID=38282 RepID=A0ABT9ZS17_9BACI|nr:hypothetical protein [Evansella vedderi]MDQ0252955.1 hypothetical protein [Evansella vedderi]